MAITEVIQLQIGEKLVITVTVTNRTMGILKIKKAWHFKVALKVKDK